MSFKVSPGVTVNEIDQTANIPAVSTTVGAFVGAFTWGPLEEITLIADETELVNNFYKPDANTYIPFFSAANFLSYSNALRVVRVADQTAALNATAEATTGSSPDGGNLYTTGTGLLIKNDEHYEDNYATGTANDGPWAAKHPGALGNSLKVSLCPSANAFGANIQGTVSSSTTTLTGTSTAFLTELEVGCQVRDAGGTEYRTITAITSDSAATINAAFTVDLSGDTVYSRWEYYDQFGVAPGTSDYGTSRSSSNDELHVIVIDEDGAFTGIQGNVLEKYAFTSKAGNAKAEDGSSNYYATRINRNSKYIRWIDHLAAGSNWGTDALSTTYTAVNQPRTFSLAGGADGNSTVDDADKQTGWDLFVSEADTDISICIAGDASATLAEYISQSVCEVRKDCVVCISPEQADVVSNAGSEVSDTISYRNSLTASSYAVMDNNWKYQYDKYNDTYRWLPLNGDIAGLMARVSDPWVSPAGMVKGQIKNAYKLAYNATEAERDDLYVVGINPVVRFYGQGVVLYGDKTLLSKPSAFDRINVRRLFIALEKAIAKSAKFVLFELNDDFTRAQFRNTVDPYLRDIQGRRGLYDFRVVCDGTNNTGEVIDRNEFVADIYLKPARSINFITLNFVATRTDISFDEIIGVV
jgi:phage tail sheath protein FI